MLNFEALINRPQTEFMRRNMGQSVILLLTCIIMMLEKTTSNLNPGPHIADVNILLPPKMTYPVEYRLQGSDGCFKWSWDHHDILSVQPEYNVSSLCSTSARLRSIAPFSGRKETAVYASDVQTGVVIRCKVFIDSISRIQIFHNSVKLDLDGLATLRVRAFDTEDNVFSSLVGLQFMWQLLPEQDGLPDHLVHVPLKDSPLSDCGGLCGDLDIQIKLEENGVFSDLYVVKGTQIGRESVFVHLLEPEFKHMADKLVLTVAEAMSVEPPSPVFVIIGAAFHYSLKVVRGNVPQVVNLPSPHHRWSVLNSSVAEVDSSLGFARALNLGSTTVMVEDIRVSGHVQISSLKVVVPDNLHLYLLPLSISGEPVEGIDANPSGAHWYIVSGRQYLVQLKVFSQGADAQEIYITENDDLKFHKDQSDYWTTFLPPAHSMIKYGWRYSRILRATSRGIGKLTASLTYISGPQQTPEVLKTEQEIIVCEQVKFNLDGMNDGFHTIFLPWAPAVYQEAEMKATGGCARSSSDYKWFCSDLAILSISASGIVKAEKPGKAIVKVVSIFDPFNYDELVVEVSVPLSMFMLQSFPVETLVGSHLQAAVTMKASNGVSFYRCDAFHPFIKWKAASETFIVVNTTEETPIVEKLGNSKLCLSVHGPPCSWTTVYASGTGQTSLHATLSEERYRPDHSFYGPILLKASSRIAAYPPLTVHQVSDGNGFGGYGLDLTLAKSSGQVESLENVYLVPRTSIDIILVGGPEKWGEDVKYIETVDELNDSRVDIKDGVHVQLVSSHSLYTVLSLAPGNFRVVFKRGNLVGDGHPLPAVAEVPVFFICSYPSSIALIVDEPVNKLDVIRTVVLADRSSGKIRVAPVTVANGRTIRIAAVGITSSGEAFANSSALPLKWELNGCEGIAYWDNNYELKSSKSNWERFLVLQNVSGQCIVRATVIGFDGIGSFNSDQRQSSGNILTDAIRLQVVSALRVDPEFNLLYFNPNAKVNLSITGGSCFLEVATNDSLVVEVRQPPGPLQCSQLMLSPKGLGTAVATVFDVGLTPPVAASAVVQVADVDWIKIVSGEEMSLMEGESRPIYVVAGTNDGNTFTSSQLAYLKIFIHIEDEIVGFVGEDNVPTLGPGPVNLLNLKIVGKFLGITSFYVSTRQQSGQEILSQPMKVEVYAPLKIHPDDIFLAPGASYMVTAKGGPTIGVYVEYTSFNEKVAMVDGSSGRLSALSPGNTTIVSKVYTNGDVVICQAYGIVKVGVPLSAKLEVQSEQLDIGREMSIYPSFPEGDLFSFYSLCKWYKWTIDDEKVLSFLIAKDLHRGKNLFPSDEKREPGFIRVLYSRSAGKTNVSVTFSCDFVSKSYSKSRKYNAFLSLSVVPNLPLALGVPITWVLPPFYTTSGLLPSAPSSHSHLDGHTRKGAIIYSILRSGSEKNEPWPKDSISIEGNQIKTTESHSVACIQAKDRTTGKIEIASCVRVAEVAQIRIRNKDFPFHVIYMAVGTEVDLPISYFDALGNPFYEALNVAPYHTDSNFHDIVLIDDTRDGGPNIHLKALRHGNALVRVSLNNNPHKSDYVLISVGPHVHPLNPILREGSSLNFILKGIDGEVTGRWYSANESVVRVDMSSGKAKAVGIGSTQVFFESPIMNLQTEVVVVSGNMISVDAPEAVMRNAPFPTEGYGFIVKLSEQGVSYDCKVDPPSVGYAKEQMDHETGTSYCIFFPYSPEHLVKSAPKLRDRRQDISVTINVSLKEANHISGSASATLIGGFSILEMDKSSMRLNLTPDHNRTSITILGNTNVDIYWKSQPSNLLNISLIHKEESAIAGRAEYEVKMLTSKRFRDKIVLRLPATGQTEEIDVSYEPLASKAKFDLYWTITVIIALIGGLALLLFLMSSGRTDSSRPLTFPASPNVAAPGTPERSPTAATSSTLSEGSPRTPQPFVEYVRRTIDETPFYKREARRRVNHQNTY